MRARLIGVVAAAFLALGVLPAGASAPSGAMASTCIDITVMISPPSWGVGFPYSCACGPALTQRPIPGGVVYTVNTGCLSSMSSGE
jgi:hypothetical protein